MALLKQDANDQSALFPKRENADMLQVLDVLARERAAAGHVLARAQPIDAAAVLRSERLALRVPTLADADTIAHLANDRRIAENTSLLPFPYTRAHALDWISLAQARGHTAEGRAGDLHTRGSPRFAAAAEARGRAFLMTLHDGTVIGACGYGMLIEPVTEIGYWLGMSYWGQGFATEAVQALIDHIFETEDDDVIAAGARVTNIASRHVIEKCGFTWIGVKLMRVRALATSVPIDRFQLTRAEWARRGKQS